jgi:hypothetical protein
MTIFWRYLFLFFAIIGLLVSLFVAIFFYQDTAIKMGKVYSISKQMIGFGADYTAFTANKLDDYLSILIRGQKYNLGIGREAYQKVDLIVDMESMSELDRQRDNPSERQWVDSKLQIYNDSDSKELFKVKVRSKGERALHLATFEDMSFKVDIKGSKRLNGMEEFSIQRPIIRNYGWEMFIDRVGSKVGLMAPKIMPIDFYFNGVNRGIYFLEEGFSSEFLESRGKKVGPIFSLNEPFGVTFPHVIYEAYETKKVNIDNEIIYDNARMKLIALKKSYKDESFDPSQYFDLQQWASYFSVIDLFRSYHGAVPKSVKLYFNPSTQLFEPIFFDNHLGGRGYLNFSLMDFSYLKDYSACGFVCMNPEWFNLFFKNNNFFNIYTSSLTSLLDTYDSGGFNDLKQGIELFNNAMYSRFAPADRVFYSSPLLYHFDTSHLDERSSLLRNKLNEYIGLDYRNESIEYADSFTKRYFENTLLKDLPFINDYCHKLKSPICSSKSINLIHKSHFTLNGKIFKIPSNSVLILSGKTNIYNSSILGSDDGSMIVQVGGEFLAKNAKFDSLSNLYIAGTNWTGAINIINSNVTTEDISISNSHGEDAINFVQSIVKSSGGFDFENIAEDALDGDNIDFLFDKISCINVGNDCLDTSNSKIKGGSIKGYEVWDKMVSFGESSSAELNLAECNFCGIGIAIKDSSFAEINQISFKNTPLEIAIFKKKNIFGPAKLVVNNSSRLGELSDEKRLISIGSSLTENGITTSGFMKSKDVEDMMYGNQYGRASN